MLDFDAGKLLIIGLVALVVIGPKDLPRVLRQVGQAVTKLRRMAGEFQGQFMDAMKEADLQDIKAELAKIKDSSTLDVDFNPVRDVKDQVTSALTTDVQAPPSDAPLMTATAETGLSGFELPTGTQIEMAHAEATAPASAPDPVADQPGSAPIQVAPDLVGEPAARVMTEPDLAADALVSLPSLGPDSARSERATSHSGIRRKIVVTRRQRLSRLDGPTLRAAVLAGHSRNIRPARRGTTDP